jgi:hypothetical protein
VQQEASQGSAEEVEDQELLKDILFLPQSYKCWRMFPISMISISHISLTASAQADILNYIDELSETDKQKLDQMASKYNIQHYVHLLRGARKDRDNQLEDLRRQQQVSYTTKFCRKNLVKSSNSHSFIVRKVPSLVELEEVAMVNENDGIPVNPISVHTGDVPHTGNQLQRENKFKFEADI